MTPPQSIADKLSEIGDLERGERKSDGERLCAYGHEVCEGHALYWPKNMGPYADDDPYCAEHAVDRAVSHWIITAKEAAALRNLLQEQVKP